MDAALPTPAKVRQLYRVILRYAAASVLYAKPAMPNLRALYRPEFDIWMTRAKASGKTELERDQFEWEEFAQRAHNTILLLDDSSKHAGLPGKVTRNLASLKYHMDPPPFIEARIPLQQRHTLSVARPEFLPGKKGRNQAEIQKLFAHDALAQVVGMAEGSARVFLGRARPRKGIQDS